MKGHPGYFMIAILLTLLNAAVSVYSGAVIWKAWPGDILDCGFWTLFAALGASSLVSVWAEAVQDFDVSRCSASAICGHSATPIPIGVQGLRNV